MYKKIALIAGAVCCLLSFPHTVSAQDSNLTATVTHIAGANVYLDIGTNQGVEAGDTLIVQKAGNPLGRLRVVSVSSKQSVVEFAGDVFTITRADKLSIVFNSATASADITAEGDVDDAINDEGKGLMAQTSNRTSSRRARQIHLSGRVMMNFSMLNSETKPQAEGLASTQRTFITPSLNLNTTVNNLPSDVKLRLNLRSDFRYNASTVLTRENTLRTYQLSLEKDLPFGQVQLGRFYNRLTPSGGYWDGVSFLFGSLKSGFGASVGYMPDRSNEGFTTQFPRFSGFAHFETRRKPQQPHVRMSASYHEVQPSTDYLDHRFFGLEQTLNWGPVSLNQDLQLDKDPASGGWIASMFQSNARVKITHWLTVRGRYSVRQPYRMYSTESPISIRRDQIQGSMDFQFLGARVGASYSTRYTTLQYESRTVNAYFNSPLVTPAQVSFFGSVNQWKSDFGAALYFNGGVSKPVGAALFRLDYGFYRSTNSNQIDAIDLSRYSFSAALPINARLYWNVRTSLQQSQYLDSITINTSLQYRF